MEAVFAAGFFDWSEHFGDVVGGQDASFERTQNVDAKSVEEDPGVPEELIEKAILKSFF